MPNNLNEVYAGRDVLIYTAPWAAANTFPTANAWGTTPPGTTPTWVLDGYTKDGLHARWRMQYQEYTVDQLIDVIARVPQSRDFRMQTNLGQLDAATMVTATGQGTSSSTAGTPAYSDFILTSTVSTNYFSAFFDVRSPISGFFARVVGWKGRSVGDIDIDFHLQDIAQVNMELAMIPDDSTTPSRIAQIEIQTG
jgi:hypothetical protein